MLTSTFGVVGLAALVLLAFGVLNPVLAVVVVVLAGLPFVLALVGGLFGSASSTVAETGPRVPSAGEASYDPVERG